LQLCARGRCLGKGNLYTGETINGRRIQKFIRVDCDDRGKGDGRSRCDD
jgi:hypothetical protein